MQYVKLQVGCLLVILYIVITYIKATHRKISCNRYFDVLLAVAPWAVFFDGLTAWTVNHMNIVPEYVNRTAHLIFFVLMDIIIIVTAKYMYNELLGERKKERENLFLAIPGILSLVLLVAGIGELHYIHGETTWYSMGFSVYVCFATLVVYYGSILFIVISRHRFLPKDKMLGTLSFIAIMGIILIVQICFPEVLLTALFPTILVLGIYVDLILKKMRHDKKYRKVLSKDYINNVSNAAPLHDIGKISTPDRILQKPGKLTDEEFATMKEHAAEGGEIILHTFKDLDNAEFRQIAYEVARHHHEKYNGRGYPDGLAGEQIPLHARIMAIADVFDAVSQKRCYRDAMPLEECFAIIENGIGTDFDPQLAKIFLDAKEEVKHLMVNTY